MPLFDNINLSTDLLQQFHFLRPLWLLAFIPMLLLIVWSWRQRKNSQSWLKVIDKKLQPYVLTQPEDQRTSNLNWLPLLALMIAVFSVAGPVWQELPQAVYKPQSALVIVLDLSRSMDATDIKPTRLTRAKHKIIDLLKARKEGQTALIVYAAQAFTVSPLTDDNETIVALLNSLDTAIMPAQGSRMDKALMTAQELMTQAGIQNGHILIVTDGVSLTEFNGIKELAIDKHTLSVLAVGTEEGSPINLAQGGYLKGANGQIVVAKMNRRDLLSIAQATQGVFATLRNDDEDINALQNLMKLNPLDNNSAQSDKTFDVWYEHGSWFLLLIIPIVLLTFRKGFLVLLVVLTFPMAQPVEAFEWRSWFKNSDQKASEQFKAGEFDAAGQQFEQADWRAASQFKSEQYDDALQHYDVVNDLYNKGNALAKMERYDDALKAWEEQLKANPKHDDAAFNKQQLEDFLKQQQEQQKDEQSKDDKQQDKEQDSEQKESDQQESDQQDQSDQKKDDQQQNKPSEEEQAEQDKAEQEQSEQEKKEQQEAKEKEQQSEQKEASQEQKDEQKSKQQLAAEQALEEQMSDPLDEETKQWLRRVPDDPGGLMRNKFRYQYKQLNTQNNEQNPW